MERLTRALAIVPCLIALTISVWAADAPKPPTLNDIVAAWDLQNKGTVFLRYRLVEVGGKPTDATDQKLETLYIRTPEVLYHKQDSEERTAERVGVLGIKNTRVRGGSNARTAGSVWAEHPSGPWVHEPGYDTFFYRLYPRCYNGKIPEPVERLYDWIRYGVISEKMEKIDGHDCWRVEIKDSNDKKTLNHVIHLDPTIGYCPRRILIDAKDEFYGKWEITVDFKDYREIAKGIWFPAELDHCRNMPKLKVDNERTITKALNLRGDKTYEPQQLLVSFPVGSRVNVEQPNGSWAECTVNEDGSYSKVEKKKPAR